MLKWGSHTPFRLTAHIFADDADEFQLKAMTRNGLIDDTITVSASGGRTVRTIGIDDMPIWVSLMSTNGAGVPNESFGSLFLDVSGEQAIHLGSGFISGSQGVSWPASQNESRMPGHGKLQTVSSTNPAAGSEISITVPDFEAWLIHSGSATLVCDGNAANRRPHFVFSVTGGNTIDIFGKDDQTAGQTKKYSLAQFSPTSDLNNDNDMMIPLPSNLWLFPEDTITTSTTSKQAGDDWGAASFTVEKFYRAN